MRSIGEKHLGFARKVFSVLIDKRLCGLIYFFAHRHVPVFVAFGLADDPFELIAGRAPFGIKPEFGGRTVVLIGGSQDVDRVATKVGDFFDRSKVRLNRINGVDAHREAKHLIGRRFGRLCDCDG